MANSTVVAFEPIGVPIAPDMFKLNPEDATFSRPLAIEQISALANVIPTIDGDLFLRTGKSVDDFYNMLLIGSQWIPTEGAPDSVLFTTLKAQAMREFEPTLGSLLMPFTQFHPSYATPGTWFDANATANWTTFNSSTGRPLPRPAPNEMLKAGSQTDAAAVAQPQTDESAEVPPQPATPATTSDWGWRIAPEAVAPVLKNPHLIGKIEQTSAGLRIKDSAPPSAKGRPNGTTSSVKAEAEDDQPESAVATSKVRQPAYEAAKLAQIASSIPGRPISSSSLSIAFQYCLVRVDRPWISYAFLATKGWQVDGYHVGAFSTGTAANNNGLFPALPVAAIAIKDLRISSNWSLSEAQVVEQAIAFGPFSLAGRTVDFASNTVVNNGVQLIGWVCQVMPLLPPDGAPAPVTPPVDVPPSEPPVVEPPVSQSQPVPAAVDQPSPLDRHLPAMMEK